MIALHTFLAILYQTQILKGKKFSSILLFNRVDLLFNHVNNSGVRILTMNYCSYLEHPVNYVFLLVNCKALLNLGIALNNLCQQL